MNKLIDNVVSKSIYSNIKNNSAVTDITWKTQESTNQHILFYKLNDTSTKSIELFKSRIKKCDYAYVITNKIHHNIKEILNIIVVDENNWLKIQKIVLDHFYPIPSNIKLFAVTGTNGKTTTVDLMSQLASLNGIKNVTIGTLGLVVNRKKELDFGLTTPSFIDLRKYLNIFGKECDYFFIEASSHALDQQRFYGLEFEASAWTSFSQDHLDYHHDMNEYFNAKSHIITLTKTKKVFLSNKSNQIAEKLESDHYIFCSELKKSIKNPFFMADYNLINLELAVEMLNVIGIKNCEQYFNQLQAPAGRFHIIEFKNNYIVIDFAHTPDAIENICSSLKQSFSNHKLITLFGCGGDRDRTKRNLMAKAALSYSDHIIVTSDNPRFEDPNQIINDIIHNLSHNTYEVIVDRETAILKAMDNLENTVLLIAGKGHEDYLEIKGIKYPYSDEAVVRKYIDDNIR